MENNKGRILISYATKTDAVKFKHKISLAKVVSNSLSGVCFVMFVYSVYNVLQILFF